MKYIFIILIFANFPTIAQDLKPLLKLDDETITSVQNQSRLITKEFDHNEQLNFKIQIPTSFIVKSEQQLKSTFFDARLDGEIFHAYGPTVYDVRPYITVNSKDINRLISVKNWFLSYALENNYTISGFEEDEKKNIDVFYVRLDSFGRSEAVRARAFAHEDRIIIIEYISPFQMYEKEKNRQTYTIQSFGFTNDFNVLRPEAVVEYEYLESFSFEYPQTWVLTRKSNELTNQHVVDLKTSDVRDFLIASVSVEVVSQRSLKDRVDRTLYQVDVIEKIKNIQNKVSEMGYSNDKILERINHDLKYDTDIAVTEVYPLRRKKSDVFMNDKQNPISNEFWMTIIKTPKTNEKAYILSMIAPSRDIDFYNWAVAKEAYELMVNTIR